MFNMFPQRKDVFHLVFSAAFLLLGLFLLWTWQKTVPTSRWAVAEDPFTIALCAASLIATGWLLWRYRDTNNSAPKTNEHLNVVARSVPTDPSTHEGDSAASTAVSGEARKWFVRLGCGAAVILLAGLVNGDLLSTFFAFVLAAVACAFIFIVFLLPRGL